MEYRIDNIDKIKMGDVLLLDIDHVTGTFPSEYADDIKHKAQSLKAEMAAYVYKKDLKIRILFKDKNFKKIGVVIDNYKLQKLLSKLTDRGFFLIETSPLENNTTAVKFDVPVEQFEKKKREVSAILNIVEAHFKRYN